MGHRLQKLSLTHPECSSLAQPPLFLAGIWNAKINACSGSLAARPRQLPPSPREHGGAQPVPAPAHHCHATGMTAMLPSQLRAGIIPGDGIVSDTSLPCCSSII